WVRQRGEHIFSYSPNLQLDVGGYIFKGKHKYSGLMFNSFWNLSIYYDKDFGGWYNNNGYYDLYKLLLAPRDFFGKSNFYWEIKFGLRAYSFKEDDLNYISPFIYPSIGFMKDLNWFKE
ncbi:MAG: hypothetical protein ACPGLV_17630, partial [Bacteroidia bacterium]